LQKLSNRKKRIGNRKKGLLLKWNMIGGYSRRLRRMRVLPPLAPLEEVGKMEEEGENRGEEDRERYLTAGLILKVVWPGILLLYESMMSRLILVGLITIRPPPLEVEGVDEEEGAEQEDVEDFLREEEGLMVMRLYSSLLDLDKHLRIEHRRPRRPDYMYNKGKLSFLRTDLFSIISTDYHSTFSSFFPSHLLFSSFLHSSTRILHSAHNRLHTICLRSLLLLYVPLPPHNLYYLPGINQLSLPSKDLDLVNLLSLAVLLPLKHALKHKHHGENHNPPHNHRDRVRIDLIIDIRLLLHNLPNYSLLSLNDKSLDLLLRSVVVRVNMPWGLLINIDLIPYRCQGQQHRYIKVIDLLPCLLKLKREWRYWKK
jgi:hypothetical protein